MTNTSTQSTCGATTETAPRPTVIPRYDVRETVDAFTLTASVPGVDRSSVETTVDGDKLTVVARRTWTPPTEWTPLHREIAQTDYRLVLTLDSRVNRDGVRAELNQGVLTLTVPKAETVKPRRIDIQD
jgi:HSP20 family protein